MNTPRPGGLTPSSGAPSWAVIGLVGLLTVGASFVMELGTATAWEAGPLWTGIKFAGPGLLILGLGWYLVDVSTSNNHW